MRTKNMGFTLVENLVALALSGVFMLGILFFMRSGAADRSASQLRAKAELAGESQAVIGQLQFYFNRAREYKVTTTPQAGQGAIVLRADMRNCDSFYPRTSSANLVSIGILCCSPKMTLAAALPSGGTLSLTSKCGNNWGLTIQEYTATGGLGPSFCKKNITEMNVSNLGKDYMRGSTNPTDILNLDFVGRTETTKDGNWSNLSRPLYFQLITTTGNTLEAPLVTCSNQGQF